jgi:hypothetical protein
MKNDHFFLFFQGLRDARNCQCTPFPTHAQWTCDIQCGTKSKFSYLHEFPADSPRATCVGIAFTSSTIRIISPLRNSWPSFHCRVFLYLSRIFCLFWGVCDHHPSTIRDETLEVFRAKLSRFLEHNIVRL